MPHHLLVQSMYLAMPPEEVFALGCMYAWRLQSTQTLSMC